VAFPAVAGSTVLGLPGNTAAASHDMTLPASVPAGAFLFVFGRVAVAGVVACSDSGWTVVNETSDASNDATFVAYKNALAAGTEGGSILTFTHGNGKMAAVAVALTGTGDPAAATPFEVGPIGTGASVNPNPPALTPAAGLQDYLWLACGCWEGEQTSPPATAPAGYTRIAADASGTAGSIATNCRVDLLYKQARATTDDPSAWTISVSDDWTAFVIAVEPPIPPTQTQVARISLAGAANVPDTRTQHKVKLRGRVTAAGGGARLRVALYEGSTLRTSGVGYLETSDLTNALADYTLPIADADAAAITSYADLELRVWGYDGAGAARTFEIDQLWLEVPAGTAAPSTPVAGSDSGSGAEASALATLTPKAAADVGAGVEVPVLAAVAAGAQTGAGADTSTPIAALAAAETGAGAEAVAVVSPVAAADVGVGAEAFALAMLLTGADSGSTADTSLRTAILAGADAAAGSEAFALAALLAAADPATATEVAALTLTQGVAGTDAGAGADLVLLLALAVADTGAGVDAAARAALLAGPDQGTGAEAAAITLAHAAADAGAAADVAAIAAVIAAYEQGASVDASLLASIIAAAETGTAAELAKITVAFAVQDAAFAAELAALAYALAVADTGSGADLLSALKLAVFDLATGGDLGTLAAAGVAFGNDAAAGADTAAMRAVLAAVETAAGLDASTLLVPRAGLDTGTGLDLLLARAIAASDTATAAEASALLSAFQAFGTDAGSSGEALLLRALLAGLDAGSDSDNAHVDAAALAQIVMVL
jgi:hypothetical protein